MQKLQLSSYKINGDIVKNMIRTVQLEKTVRKCG